MKNIIEKFHQINKRLYKGARNPLRSHGPDHHRRVCLYVLDLAKKLEKAKSVKADKEVLIAASFLHDLAAFYPEKFKGDSHEKDHILAEKILRKINFPKEKIKKVTEAIKNHGSDQKYKRKGEPIETAILRDADKIDAFGPLGVARIIMARTMNGDTLNNIVDDFYTKGHLKRKWDSITINEAKTKHRKDYEYSLDFFAKLDKSLRK